MSAKGNGIRVDFPKSGPGKAAPPSTIHYPFWFGGSASCFAVAVTHPLDLVKVRLQTRGPDAPKTMIRTFIHIVKNNGVLGLYNGLSAAFLRQMTYSTARFGIYEELKHVFTTTAPSSQPSFPALVAMASTSGFMGGIVGNAADVLNVRMQNDMSLPPSQRRNYRHAVDGLARMVREEGPSSLFRGLWPNATRAMLMTASQLASYDVFKRLLMAHLPMGDNLQTHFSASFLAGAVASTIASPIDVVKTRIMSSSAARQGLVEIVRDISRKEGVGWVFKGWLPSFIRLGPHTIFTFIFLEQHKKIFRKAKGLD